MPGISGGITASGAPYTRRRATSDVLDGYELDVTEPNSEAPTQDSVIIKVSHEGRIARICLQKSLATSQFEQLVFAALGVTNTSNLQIVGLETPDMTIVPISLVCRSPSVLDPHAPGHHTLLVKELQESAGTRKGLQYSSRKFLIEKIVDFARILHAHSYLTLEEARQIEHILRKNSDLAWAVCRVYRAFSDPDLLLQVLKWLASATNDEVTFTCDIIQVTEIVAGATGAGFPTPLLLHIFYLALTGDKRLHQSFLELCDTGDEAAYLDDLAAFDDANSFAQACADVVSQLEDNNLMSEEDANIIRAKLLPPNPDDFVRAAFELLDDEGDIDEFMDTLTRICDQERALLRTRELDDEAMHDAFESALESLVERGLLEPVESAWLLGRRVASDPTIVAILQSFQDGIEAAELQIVKFAKLWDDFLTKHNLHLATIVEDMRGTLINDDEADVLSALVMNSNNLVVSAFEAFAVDVDLDELQDTLQLIAARYLDTDGQVHDSKRRDSGSESDSEQEEFIKAEWRKELQRLEEDDGLGSDSNDDLVAADADSSRPSSDEDFPEEVSYFVMALRFLVHKGSLTADMADKVMFMFRANDDNVRAAFKVHEITRDDDDLVETLLLIFESEGTRFESGDTDGDGEADDMTASLFELVMSMVHKKEVTVEEGFVLRRLLKSNHDRILQIWENYSEDRDRQKLKESLCDIARKVDAIYNESETSDGSEDDDDDSGDNSDDSNDVAPNLEDEIDEDEDEDEDVKGLAEETGTDDNPTSVQQEEAEEQEALFDAYEVMADEEVSFLASLREEHPDSHFHEVMAGAAKVYSLDQDLDSFVETLRLVVTQAAETMNDQPQSEDRETNGNGHASPEDDSAEN